MADTGVGTLIWLILIRIFLYYLGQNSTSEQKASPSSPSAATAVRTVDGPQVSKPTTGCAALSDPLLRGRCYESVFMAGLVTPHLHPRGNNPATSRMVF